MPLLVVHTFAMSLDTYSTYANTSIYIFQIMC